MEQGILKRCFSFFLCCFIAVFYTISNAVPSALYDDERSAEYREDHCDTGSIDYNPFGYNKDLIWQFSNPHCAGFIAGVGAAMMASGVTARYACKATNNIGMSKTTYEEAAELEWDQPIITPGVARKLVNRYVRCANRQSESATWASLNAVAIATGYPNPYYTSQAGFAGKDVIACCASYTSYAVTVAAALSSLAIMWDVANATFKKSHICGEGWKTWEKQCKDPESGCVEKDKIWVKTKGKYQKCLFKVFAENNPQAAECSGNDSSKWTTKITDQHYREYIFGGYEREDNVCENPGWDGAEKKLRLGYDSKYQRYYTRGGGESISFACHRFLSSDPNDAKAAKAFACCKSRSQEATCIHGENRLDSEDKFCKVGEKCKVGGITFQVYDSTKTPNYFCVKTYSSCPYNHLLGGGTEKSVPDPDDKSLTKNTCQYMYHCTKVPILPYVRMSNLEGGYISSACKDMKGDSQNFYSYDAGVIPLNVKNFSAPMAQCFKETLENILLNRGGDTKCADPDEFPVKGVCASGNYEYRKGEMLKGKSIFTRLQDNVRNIIKIMLVLSVTAFGVMILFAVGEIEKKKLLPYLMKIGLVLYFATGDAWQTKFMEGILNSSTFISELVFNVDETAPENQLDGCQFPRYNYADSNPDTKYSNASYPPMKGYLKIWDTLDCKLAKALGFGPEASVPNIILMIVGGLFTQGLGLVFVVASLLFAFLMIALIIRALHIFLLSIVSMVILIYVSPITIAAALFEKTKGIFQGWWKQLLGFALQPMILFAYLSIMITIFDHITIGPDARFNGDGKSQLKVMSCAGDAANTSLYCIFRVPNIKTNHALEVIGIGIPFLTSMNATKLNTIVKGALLMFIFYSFMEKVSYFASKLVGGSELKGWAPSVGGMAKKAYSLGSGIRERAEGALAKHGIGGAKKLREGIKSLGRTAGGSGKAIARVADVDGANTTKSGVDANAASSGRRSNVSKPPIQPNNSSSTTTP